jgi:hypothetical protein
LEGSNIDSVLGISKEREESSFHKKIRPTDDLSRVPPDVRVIRLNDLQTYQLNSFTFFKYEDDHLKIFFLENELEFLQNMEWYCDGTFKIMKDQTESQCYIISILFENDDKTRCFSYPIVFCFCRGKSQATYSKIFSN